MQGRTYKYGVYLCLFGDAGALNQSLNGKAQQIGKLVLTDAAAHTAEAGTHAVYKYYVSHVFFLLIIYRH